MNILFEVGLLARSRRFLDDKAARSLCSNTHKPPGMFASPLRPRLSTSRPICCLSNQVPRGQGLAFGFDLHLANQMQIYPLDIEE